MDRRNFMRLGSAASVALLANPERVLGQEGERRAPIASPRARPAARGPGGQPGVITPNGHTLALRNVGPVRVGHLVAQEIEH
ncbi:MAG: copper oxidase, partial [Deltaproteobacteria bacterium]|nr:copper oxidase [Deltaproteobacteria bacterium]